MIEEQSFLLLGMGRGNKAIQNYFEHMNIDYQIYDDATPTSIDLSRIDVVIKSSGISPSHAIIQACLKKNIKIWTDLELFSLIKKDAFMIGITGSNGKTTTTTLIYQMLENTFSYEICGNIGISIMNYAQSNEPGYVIECSSYMLEYATHFHPRIFVLLNIIPHHLEHHKDFESYLSSKTIPLKNMNYNDYLIYNLDDENIVKSIASARTHKLSFSNYNHQATVYRDDHWIYYLDQPYLNISAFSIKNSTMMSDYMAAILVGKMMKISDEIIKKVLINFKGLPHRQEIVFKNNDLLIINDSKATNPAATLCAFENLNLDKSSTQLLWIGGGKLIADNYELLKPYMSKIKKTYLYGENQDMLVNELLLNNFSYQLFPTLEASIKQVFNDLNSPTIILFSPASPSTDMFKSFEERGNCFKKIVQELLSECDV